MSTDAAAPLDQVTIVVANMIIATTFLSSKRTTQGAQIVF